MPARVGDRYRFEYPNEPHFNREVTIMRVLGDGPEDLVLFDDHTHTKQKHLTDAMRLSAPPLPLPCPFCGGGARVLPQVIGTAGDVGYSVDCTVCLAKVVEVTSFTEQVIAHWNKRTEPWVSVDERLPDNGDTVLAWERDTSEWSRANGRPPGKAEIVTFKLTRRDYVDCEPTDPRYYKKQEIADPTFRWEGGDCEVEWRKSDGFAHSGGYSGEVSETHHITHWRPLPAPPR